MRLRDFDYSQNGAYYLTVCTKDRQNLLGEVVGGGILDVPFVELSECGKIIEETIEFLDNTKNEIVIDKYVIMPNHVHLIVVINDPCGGDLCGRASGMPPPTKMQPANAVIPKIISSIKRFTNKKIGLDIWQRSYHDHVIRNQADYLRIWQYIDENPVKWTEDEYYCDRG